MSTQTLEKPQANNTDRHLPPVTHLLCNCRKDRAVCGTPIHRLVPRGSVRERDLCAMCLAEQRCPVCGRKVEP